MNIKQVWTGFEVLPGVPVYLEARSTIHTCGGEAYDSYDLVLVADHVELISLTGDTEDVGELMAKLMIHWDLSPETAYHFARDLLNKFSVKRAGTFYG